MKKLLILAALCSSLTARYETSADTFNRPKEEEQGVYDSHQKSEMDMLSSTQKLAAYNIVWTTQSRNSSESMPLAGGILGLNVWVENDDLCFLIGSPNCMDESGMQVKLGLARLHLTPAAFGKDFKQELCLRQSEIAVSGKTASGAPVAIKLWCGVDKPVVHVEISSGEPVEATATYETWSNFEAKVVGNALQWVHRLEEVNGRRQRDLKAQGMTEFSKVVPDPLSSLTMGGRITAPGMVDAGAGQTKFNDMNTKTCALRTAVPVTQLDLCITLRMEQDKSIAEWESQLDKDAEAAVKNAASDHAAAIAWWDEFWGRSHIFINPGAPETDKAWQVGRNYQLFRYQLAANRNGRAMTLFNGGIFPCEGNPDKRIWDSCQFMAQNQRPMAWAELKTGDYDLLKVSLDFYRDRTEMSRLHAKKFWGVDGVAYSEPFSIFGLDAIGTTSDGRSQPGHLSYHYTSGMEFALLMLELGRFTGQDISGYLDPAEGIIRYYDQFYQEANAKKTGKSLNENGQLVIYPSDALEIFHGCTNNTDVICGLEALSQGLLDLPDKYLTPEKRAYYREFQKRIPPITISEVSGHKVVAPAKSYEWVFENGNMEFPNMYVCFPFNHFFLGRPGNGIELASDTWDYGALRPGVQKQSQCWYQSAINLARMGRTADAKRCILQKLVNNPHLRFPTFWTNYGFCHAPDTDHGATAMIGLQEMIMQTDGQRILLGAAWPAEWTGSFKLHAPYQTTVEGHVADGKVVVDKVAPESRHKDVEIFQLKKSPPLPVSEGKLAKASSEWDGKYSAGKAYDGDLGTRWSAAAGQKTGWIEVDLGKPETITRAVVQEVSYPRVNKFILESQEPNGRWKSVVEGGALGPDKEIRLPTPVTAQKFRLNILDAADSPTIDEMQLFAN